MENAAQDPWLLPITERLAPDHGSYLFFDGSMLVIYPLVGSSRRWYRQLLPVVQNVAAAAPAGGIPRGAIIETAMTDEDIAFARLKASLLQAMRRNPGTGVRVTVESLVAAAELVKDDQAECIEVAGQLFIREPV